MYYKEEDTNSSIHYYLPECIALNYNALCHFLPECITPQTTKGCHTIKLFFMQWGSLEIWTINIIIIVTS